MLRHAADEYLLHQADYRELNRCRKDELVRLYSLAGLTGSAEDLTKSDIINSIISGRIDDDEVPPSSPPGKTDGGYSSDEGHDGGGEETDVAGTSVTSPLRRRSTVQEFGRAVRRTAAALGRSFSLTGGDASRGLNQKKKCARISKDVKSPCHHDPRNGSLKCVIVLLCIDPLSLLWIIRNRHVASRCSPSQTSSVPSPLPSPPATRLRSRTISAESKTSSLASSRAKGSLSGSSRRTRTRHTEVQGHRAGDDDDVTATQQPSISNPSPRRLRSKVLDSVSSQEGPNDAESRKKRIVPMRRVKGKIGSLKEESTATESDEEGSSDNAVDEEVDELDSAPSSFVNPEPRQNRPKEQRTPMKRRLRPRRLQTHTPPSDGDDEEEDESEQEQEEEDGDEDQSEDTASVEGDEEDQDEEDAEEDEGAVEDEGDAPEPRILRNGKVIGEDAASDEDSGEGSEDVTEENSSSEIDIDQESDTGESAEGDEEMLDETEDEVMEDGTS